MLSKNCSQRLLQFFYVPRLGAPRFALLMATPSNRMGALIVSRLFMHRNLARNANPLGANGGAGKPQLKMTKLVEGRKVRCAGGTGDSYGRTIVAYSGSCDAEQRMTGLSPIQTHQNFSACARRNPLWRRSEYPCCTAAGKVAICATRSEIDYGNEKTAGLCGLVQSRRMQFQNDHGYVCTLVTEDSAMPQMRRTGHSNPD
jgi:hypothetical protein